MKLISLACALTWDGSRFAMEKIPSFARAYLLCSRWPVLPDPPADQLPGLLQARQVAELKICWVPVLAGGAALGQPGLLQKRLAFRLAWHRTVAGHTLTLYRPYPEMVTLPKHAPS